MPSPNGNRPVSIRMLVSTLLLLAATGSITMHPSRETNVVHAAESPWSAVLDEVNRIVSLLDPAPREMVLSTGYAYLRDRDGLTCSFANVGQTVIIVNQRIRRLDGAALLDVNANVGPGEGAGEPVPGVQGFFRCEFTFTGVPSSARATMIVHAPDGMILEVLDAR